VKSGRDMLKTRVYGHSRDDHKFNIMCREVYILTLDDELKNNSIGIHLFGVYT
jgi:hypothetical protein